jgi:threonylcarbamoyladenosine tRNA methylthiotransferase MtaB
MKRNYTAQHLKNIIQRTKNMKRSQANLISLGADLIVGFPGEEESDFLETLQKVEEYGITKLHAFPFSDHHKGETIPASLYPHQVPQEIKKERESRLLSVGEKVRNDFIAKNAGAQHTVLIEEYRKGKWRGRTENYIQVELEGEYQKGQIVLHTLF